MNRNRIIRTLASLRAMLFVFALLAALAPALMSVTAASAGGPATHNVSAGGPDLCISVFGEHPGCDGNFSLEGHVYADGSMSGQYTDRWPNGDGFHAIINCVSVVGSDAWVSGVITSGTFDGQDLAGLTVSTVVRDRGTSANDPADQISFSWIGEQIICTDHIHYPVYDVPQGQVTVK